jgi:GNAT superfamily N-acetyltransferase
VFRNTVARAFCIFYPLPDGEIFIDYLGVDPEMQGLGLGGRLLKYMLSTHPALSLLCTEERRGFYEKHGFKKRFTDNGWNNMAIHL